MIDDGLSTAELFAQAGACLTAVERCAKTNRRRDHAFDQLTTLFLLVDCLSRRLGALDWQARPPTIDDDDEQLEDAVDHARPISLAETVGSFHDDTSASHVELRNELQRCLDTEEPLEALVGLFLDMYLEVFRKIISFTCRGCTSAEEVTKKWLALVRRVDPHSLAGIGLSQTDVARALGERRATTSQREKREFEKPVKTSGARGYRNAGGTRTEANRERCRTAQKGNRNRAKGQADETDSTSGYPEVKKQKKKPTTES